MSGTESMGAEARPCIGVGPGRRCLSGASAIYPELRCPDCDATFRRATGQAVRPESDPWYIRPLFPAPRVEHPECAFTVHGEPVPCGRPRARIVTPRGKAPFIHMHPDAKSEAYEKLVSEVACPARPAGWRLDWAAYDLRVRVYQRERRGDGDNFAKAVADGCAGVLWENDRRIRSWRIDILDDLDRPRLEVLATMLGELDAEADQKARARLLAARRKA